MKKDEKFRCGLAVVEQPNGYYVVNASVAHGHTDRGTSTSYPNLTWVETCTLVLALLEEWSEVRESKPGAVSADPWVQLSFLDIGVPGV